LSNCRVLTIVFSSCTIPHSPQYTVPLAESVYISEDPQLLQFMGKFLSVYLACKFMGKF